MLYAMRVQEGAWHLISLPPKNCYSYMTDNPKGP